MARTLRQAQGGSFRGDVSGVDEVLIFWRKEKELKAYGDAAQSDEEIGVGEEG